MPIEDIQIEAFRAQLKDMGEDLSFAEAQGRHLRLLLLIWTFLHQPPEGDEPWEAPPPPPWL